MQLQKKDSLVELMKFKEKKTETTRRSIRVQSFQVAISFISFLLRHIFEGEQEHAMFFSSLWKTSLRYQYALGQGEISSGRFEG